MQAAGDGNWGWPVALAKGAFTLLVPVFPERTPIGPQSAREVMISLLAMCLLCALAGRILTQSSILLRIASVFHTDIRDEAWEELKLTSPHAPESEMNVEEAERRDDVNKSGSPKKRTATELLFIAVHNSAVSFLALLAWALGSPALAMHAFNLEVAYEVFDTCSLRMNRLEPETLVHHIVSPICILCSLQTDVDFRVLCHLCFCIDSSGALLGYSKFLLHYGHVSASRIYRNLTWAYAVLRVALPLVDTVIIVRREAIAKGGFFALGTTTALENGTLVFPATDWTQLYFWAMAMLNSFNIYFFLVIRARAQMPPHVVASYEARTGCR